MIPKTPLLVAMLATMALAGCISSDLPLDDPTGLLPADPTTLLSDGSLSGIMNLHILEVAGGAFTLVELDDALVLLDDSSGIGDTDQEVLKALGALGVSDVDQIVRSRADVHGAPACRELFSGLGPDRIVAIASDDVVRTAQGCAESAADIGSVLSLAGAAPDDILALGGSASADVLHFGTDGGAGLDGALFNIHHGDIDALVPGTLACDLDAGALPVALPQVDVLPIGGLGALNDACASVMGVAAPALTVLAGPQKQAQGLLSSLLDLAAPLGLPVHAATGFDHVVVSSDGDLVSILEMKDLVALDADAATGVTDTVLPTVVSWSAAPANVAPGEVVELTMTMKDAGSGIAAGAFGLTPAASDVDPAALVGQVKANAKEIVWTAQYVVPADAPAGAWGLAFVAVRDAAGNAAVAAFGSPAFTVLDSAKAAGDDLVGWSIDIRELARGEALVLAFSATDVPSHLSAVEAAVRDPSGTVHDAMELRVVDDAAGKADLMWALDLPVDAPVGAWHIVSATGHDAQGQVLDLVPRDAGDQVFAVAPDVHWIVAMAPDTSSITLTNPEGAARDLSGWALETTEGVRYELPAGTSLPAGGRIVAHAGAGADSAKAVYADLEGAVWGAAGAVELVSPAGIVDVATL